MVINYAEWCHFSPDALLRFSAPQQHGMWWSVELSHNRLLLENHLLCPLLLYCQLLIFPIMHILNWQSVIQSVLPFPHVSQCYMVRALSKSVVCGYVRSVAEKELNLKGSHLKFSQETLYFDSSSISVCGLESTNIYINDIIYSNRVLLCHFWWGLL